MEKPAAACYHLPGLFEFYELYRRFLPLYREHREYFYDWCAIGSIYGAPAGCIWGGGRISSGGVAAREVLALLREYGISGRLTFSNSLLRAQHLADPQCNALCEQFAKSGGVPNGVIVHSDLLADYLRQRWPELYLVSSTTKVLTEFAQLQQELAKPQFRYVVPDFRLNPALEQLRTLPPEQKAKVEFLCNECCWFGCTERKRCYATVSRQNLVWSEGSTAGVSDNFIVGDSGAIFKSSRVSLAEFLRTFVIGMSPLHFSRPGAVPVELHPVGR